MDAEYHPLEDLSVALFYLLGTIVFSLSTALKHIIIPLAFGTVTPLLMDLGWIAFIDMPLLATFLGSWQHLQTVGIIQIGLLLCPSIMIHVCVPSIIWCKETLFASPLKTIFGFLLVPIILIAIALFLDTIENKL